MSVYNINDTDFYPVAGNPLIGRYIDIRKFISMLLTNALFFVRVSKLEDPYEGMYPKRTKEELIKLRKRLIERDSTVKKLTESEIEEKVIAHIDGSLKVRELTCINSWHSFENENYLLWKTYSNIDAGIVILSSYEKLFNELDKIFDKQFIISRIEYKDYDTDYFGAFSTNLPFIHKPHFYHDEKEIRVLYEVPHNDWIHDWSNEQNENGLYVPINLQNLIDEIIVAPFAPKWYFELIESLNEKYSLNKPVKYSRLRRIPEGETPLPTSLPQR